MRLFGQVSRSASPQVNRSLSQQVSKSAGQQVNRSLSQQVSKSTGQPVGRSAGARLLLCSLLSVSLLASVIAQDRVSAPEFSATLSRTAIHIGDVFEYRITIRHSPDVSFVTQELDKTLVVRPFELLAVRADQKNVGNQVVLDVVLKLVCYEKPGKLQIPSFSLFYYPTKSARLPGQGPAGQKDIPAQELVVPARPLNLQSTLLGKDDQLRDAVALLSFPRRDLILPAVAAALLLVILAWLAFIGTLYAVKMVKRKQVVDEEQLRSETLQSLRELQRRVVSDGQRPSIYLDISKVLRRYLQSRYGFSCQALTPEEARAALWQNTSDREYAEKAESILERCDDGCFNRAASSWPDPAALCEQATSLVKSGPRHAR